MALKRIHRRYGGQIIVCISAGHSYCSGFFTRLISSVREQRINIQLMSSCFERLVRLRVLNSLILRPHYSDPISLPTHSSLFLRHYWQESVTLVLVCKPANGWTFPLQEVAASARSMLIARALRV